MLTDLPWKTILAIAVIALSGGIIGAVVLYVRPFWSLIVIALSGVSGFFTATRGPMATTPIGYVAELVCWVVVTLIGLEVGERFCTWLDEDPPSPFPDY